MTLTPHFDKTDQSIGGSRVCLSGDSIGANASQTDTVGVIHFGEY